VEQPRLHAPVFAVAPVAGVATALGRQEFWQFIACVSQLIWHVSVVVFKVGVTRGTGGEV
jgi:hypothetical protein